MITVTWLAWYIAFTLLLVGLAWWPCCCGEQCIQCPNCDDPGPCTQSVTFSGAAAGTCGCSEVNATFIVGYDTVCIWGSPTSYTGDHCWDYDCGSDTYNVCVFVIVDRIDPLIYVRTNVNVSRWSGGNRESTQRIVHEYTVSASTIDCEATYSLPWLGSVQVTGSGDDPCDFSEWEDSSTCQVN